MRMCLLAAAAVLCTLRGCVVYEIRDALEESNRKLEVSNTRLNEIKADLARTNEAMEKVQGELAASTASLSDVQKRLEVLRSIGASLESIDASLKIVRGLIERIPIVGKDIEREAK